MTEAIRIHNTGGPEVMSWEEVTLAAPGPGEALVRHHCVGVNFVDVYHRRGVYKLPLPSGLGSEAAGVVEAVGPGVTDFQPGDRVACGTGPVGLTQRHAWWPWSAWCVCLTTSMIEPLPASC